MSILNAGLTGYCHIWAVFYWHFDHQVVIFNQMQLWRRWYHNGWHISRNNSDTVTPGQSKHLICIHMFKNLFFKLVLTFTYTFMAETSSDDCWTDRESRQLFLTLWFSRILSSWHRPTTYYSTYTVSAVFLYLLNLCFVFLSSLSLSLSLIWVLFFWICVFLIYTSERLIWLYCTIFIFIFYIYLSDKSCSFMPILN